MMKNCIFFIKSRFFTKKGRFLRDFFIQTN